MRSQTPTRSSALGLTCVWLFFSPLHAGPQTRPAAAAPPASSTLPSTQPTVQPTTPLHVNPVSHEPKHAEVAYSRGLLFLSANDSSLNQILRQISRDTGIKITGGVADERVFGQYGPSSPSQVLAALLDGTGSNMLLLHRDGSTPAELVLTPRLDGPTPPNPNAAMFNEQTEPEDTRDQERNRNYVPSFPPDQNPGAASYPPNSPTGASQNGAAEPQSPNGVKTPQQIYDQLQRMRQQQTPLQ